jgi:hypothetical protein
MSQTVWQNEWQKIILMSAMDLMQVNSLFVLMLYTSRAVIVLGYGLDDQGSRFRFLGGLGTFLFTTASRTALWPTQPPIQWVPGALSLGVKWLGCEADHSTPSSAKVKE